MVFFGALGRGGIITLPYVLEGLYRLISVVSRYMAFSVGLERYMVVCGGAAGLGMVMFVNSL